MAKVGRPPIHKTAKDLQAACDDYFKTCVANELPFTISGLVDHLGFMSYQSLFDQEKRGPEFSEIVKRSKMKVRRYLHEKLLTESKFTGACAFDLKCNHGWRDSIDINTEGSLTINIQNKEWPKRKNSQDKGDDNE
jgi:hypothetical protein